MSSIHELLTHGVEQLFARAGGPLHFRIFVMPTVVTLLAIRAGLRDARMGRPTFGWGVVARPDRREELLASARKDIGRVFIMALIMDTAYQLLVLRWLYVGQLLIVAVVCAVVPYVLVRGPSSLVARRFVAKTKPDAHGSPST